MSSFNMQPTNYQAQVPALAALCMVLTVFFGVMALQTTCRHSHLKVFLEKSPYLISESAIQYFA